MTDLRDLLHTLPVAQEDLAFFSRLPSVQPYLSKTSHYQVIPFISRYERGQKHDQFFKKIINTHDTVPRVLTFMRKPDITSSNEDHSPEPDYVVFAQLESGINGWEDTAHGGVLAALFDESLGLCAEAYRVFNKDSNETGTLYTATLDVSYRAPVLTPSAMQIQTWVRRREGRKWFLEAKMLDQDGAVRAEAKSLYISERASL
ncbi:hypothetical protein N7474_001916 [Penicillium riverlandense]|uniref:uncharacterized protein n=1 Tax=Penicillium riverlandense TaxID=1903569 RepID=UPI0025476684|nr:uncharacterized protein N7474_001916 [Penicillium riverlandense]KAJ5833605.1 hypothetical protein N7474_001916 [Penicillium riverlandense]